MDDKELHTQAISWLYNFDTTTWPDNSVKILRYVISKVLQPDYSKNFLLKIRLKNGDFGRLEHYPDNETAELMLKVLISNSKKSRATIKKCTLDLLENLGYKVEIVPQETNLLLKNNPNKGDK